MTTKQLSRKLDSKIVLQNKPNWFKLCRPKRAAPSLRRHYQSRDQAAANVPRFQFQKLNLLLRFRPGAQNLLKKEI